MDYDPHQLGAPNGTEVSRPLVLVAGHLPWSEQWQTPHYIAELLVQHATVLYVEPPVAWYPASSDFRVSRVLHCGELRRASENLFVFTPPALPLGRFGVVQSCNEAVLHWALRARLARLRPSDLYLWICATRHGPELCRLFPQAPCIFHAIDYFVSRRDAAAAAYLAERADIVLSASPAIAREMQRYNSNIAMLPNGWRFSEGSMMGQDHPELSRIPRPRIGLVGFLSSNLDYELLQQVAETCRCSVVIVGGREGELDAVDRRALRSLLTRGNVFPVGLQPLASLPAWIRGFDVCIAPYKQNERILGSNPLKVYQYLAMGKPVIATDVEVLRELVPLVRVGTSREAFLKALGEELTCSTEEKWRSQRIQVAQRTTWPERWKATRELLMAQPRFKPLFRVPGERLGNPMR